ncbi:hypothetical protein ACSNOI_37740, partial [Actinomadura kijaniata]|uniref:hypothetical protein n=1 Tax=Actinomadura kijaniata TaxID=46161 RepID=UPI003F1C4624
TRTPSGRDGFAPGHPRQNAPNTDGNGSLSRGTSTDPPPGNGADPNADGRRNDGNGSSNGQPERSDSSIADDGGVRPVPEGHYRLASDPHPYIRDLENGRLHHPEDEPGTYRTEKSYRLKRGARFVDDPLADRSREITYEERRTRKVPFALSSSARETMDALVERRSEIDAARQQDNQELKRLVTRFGIRKEDVNSDEKLAGKREEILAEMESGDLSPEERRRMRDDLRSLYEVARRYNAAGSAMSRISEQMGMVAAKDFLDGRYGVALITPQGLAPGKPNTADVTAVAFERGRGGESAVLYTVEAKGVGSQLGSRLVEDMKRAAQGAPKYSRFILKRDIDLKAALDGRPELQKRLREELEKENLRVRSYYVHVNDQGEVNWARFHLDRDGAPIRFTEIAGINV